VIVRTNEPPPAAPDPVQTVEDEPGRYTTLDEAGMESFPASDPIAVDSDEPIASGDQQSARK
jgi:hypothetical protein